MARSGASRQDARVSGPIDRVWVLALLLSVGCGGEEPRAPRAPTQTLELEGFRVHVPAAFSDLEPERVAQLEAAPRATDPNASSQVRAVRGEHSSQGSVMLIRVEHPQPQLEGVTVQDALRAAVELDLGAARGPGASIVSHEVVPGATWLDSWLHASVREGAMELHIHTRSTYWLEEDSDLVVLGVQCMAPPNVHRQLCPAVIESFERPATIDGQALDASR